MKTITYYLLDLSFSFKKIVITPIVIDVITI